MKHLKFILSAIALLIVTSTGAKKYDAFTITISSRSTTITVGFATICPRMSSPKTLLAGGLSMVDGTPKQRFGNFGLSSAMKSWTSTRH